MKMKKKDAPMYMEGGKMQKMKKKEVTGVNAVMANTRGIRGSGPLSTKAVGTASSKKGANSGSSDEYKMMKTLKGTKTDRKGKLTRYVGMKNGGKMPMYMYGGKVYAEKGAMLKAILKDPAQAKMARKELGMK